MHNSTSLPLNAQVLVPYSELKGSLQQMIREEIRAKQADDLQEKYLSPKETCKLFHPSISLVTLHSWADKGLLTKYHISGRTYYKYSEILTAVKALKKYQRHGISQPQILSNGK